MNATIALTVNGRQVTVATDPQRPLLDVLREDLQLTGTKYGCGEGQCGACTVLLDGRRVRSCSTPVAKADGKTVLTIEGLAKGDVLHPIQEAFLAEGAFQCGYCTPGMIMSAVALLNQTPEPTDAQILAWMDGNVCRCCGYPRILKAVRRAASGRKQENKTTDKRG
jgi:aerobic-type carbon monoxide dehydrogenase small subunit (CoxS/CutS family)